MEVSSANIPASAALPWRRVAERFVHLKEPGGQAFYEALARHFAHLVDHPVLPLHFEYAATANARGRAAAERLARIAPLGRRGIWRRRTRVLDVGCAYGGFLVAFAERGARVAGLEIDERYVRLAALNLRERGLEGELVHGDAAAQYPAFRERFDLVIANDILEHVPDPGAFLGRVREWLAPAGTAYLEIPNGSWPPYVLRDGHHQLFGIALLDFHEASKYVRALSPGGRYDTYNYPTFSQCERLFAGASLSFSLLDETSPGASVESVLAECERLREGTPAGLQTVPETLRTLVAGRVAAYLDRVSSAPRSSPAEIRRFLLDYASPFWTVLARRA